MFQVMDFLKYSRLRRSTLFGEAQFRELMNDLPDSVAADVATAMHGEQLGQVQQLPESRG